MGKGKKYNADWTDGSFPKRKPAVERIGNESRDVYELKCLNKTDINMIRARKWFDRPPYYLKKRESNQDLGFNPYQE